MKLEIQLDEDYDTKEELLWVEEPKIGQDIIDNYVYNGNYSAFRFKGLKIDEDTVLNALYDYFDKRTNETFTASQIDDLFEEHERSINDETKLSRIKKITLKYIKNLLDIKELGD